jgi:hypothetical protein
MARHWHKINEERYKELKTVLDNLQPFNRGNTIVIKALGIGQGTASYIRHSNSYAEYRKISNERAGGKKVEEPKEVVDKSATKIAKTEILVNKEQSQLIEVLKDINKSLIRLSVAWESAPSKKGWLK